MKLKTKQDDWFDIVFGVFTSLICFVPIIIFILLLLEIKIEFYYFIIPIFIIIYLQRQDQYFEKINTNISDENNYKIVTKTLDDLKWEHYKSYGEIKFRNNKFYLNFIDVAIITKSKTVYYSFKYNKTYRTGRLVFFFGLSSILKYVFIFNLKKELKKNY